MTTQPTTRQARRRRAVALAVLAAAVVLVLLLVLVLGGSGSAPKKLVPGGEGSGVYDPLGYDSGHEQDLVKRASTGYSDVVYEKSPGGVVATARRVARWRPLIDRAAKANGIDPDILEAIVFLESAGRADVIAGGDINGAVGLTQILPSTATALLRMHVDTARSRTLTRKIAAATTAAKARKLERARRRADERFDPAKAITAAAIYLAEAQRKFGRADLAVATYHMGMGNLATVLSRYSAQGGDSHPSYARLYFDTAPLRKPRAYDLLYSLGDDSSTYLWRVLAAKEIMRLSRQDPQQLRHLESLDDTAGGGARRLYPNGAPAGNPGGPYPATAAVLAYIRAGIRAISGPRPLRVTSAHGLRIDVSRRYASRAQAQAFQFLLDRLQAWNLIAWARVGNTIAIVVGPEAAKVLPSAAQITRDANRPK